jgi:hypothetical protein
MEAAGSSETLVKIGLHGVTSQKAVAYSNPHEDGETSSETSSARKYLL